MPFSLLHLSLKRIMHLITSSSSSSLLFFVVLGFFLMLSISDSEYSQCRSFKCVCGSTLYDIDYPFRLQQHSPDFCGHPLFDLRCQDNTLLTTIDNKDYVVNSIDYNTHTLHLIDRNFVTNNQECNAFTNSSFNPRLFEYNDIGANFTVYFNCSSFFSNPVLRSLSCFEGGEGLQSFYTPPGEPPLPYGVVSQYCTSLVVVPMNISVNLPTDFAKALMQGFGITWKVGDGWCNRCMDSGGVCGNDGSLANGEACFCSDSGSVDGACVSTAGMFS